MSDVIVHNIWDAIESDPVEAQAMKIRAKLLHAVIDAIRNQGWSAAETARRLDIERGRASDLMRGKINRFSIDALLNFSHKVGLRVSVDVTDAG